MTDTTPVDLSMEIPDLPTDLPVDGAFDLYVDNDRMSASVTIDPPQRGGVAVAEEQVRVAMTERGVVAGILDEALREAVEQSSSTSVRIAAGLEPTPGQPTVFTSLIASPLELRAEAGADDAEDDETYTRIDYRDMGSLILVTPGIPLMRRTPAVPGIPGFDVSGKVIELPPMQDQPFADGLAGVAISEDDPNLLVAAISGAPKVMETGVSVVALVEVDAVNLDTGNIDFDGSLKVKGDIVAGMRVHVTGDVIVAGTIEAAEVHAGGNIVVNGGIIGMTDTVATDGQEQSRAARLVCEGSVKARFILHAQIDAAKIVAAEREIRQSVVDAGDCVTVGPPGSQNGVIVGGRIRALNSVQAGVLGSAASMRTDIQVGLNPRTDARATILQQKRKDLTEQQTKLEKLLMFLQANPQKDVNNVGQRARETYKHTFSELTALKAEEDEIIKALVPKADAYVAVKKRIHGGVRMRVGNKAQEFREDYPGGKARVGPNGDISLN